MMQLGVMAPLNSVYFSCELSHHGHYFGILSDNKGSGRQHVRGPWTRDTHVFTKLLLSLGEKNAVLG